jgi:hypothetical protein
MTALTPIADRVIKWRQRCYKTHVTAPFYVG